MGFFKKIFRRGKSKKAQNKEGDGAFLPDNVQNRHEDIIRKPSFQKNSSAAYNPYPTPDLSLSISESRSQGVKSRGSRSSRDPKSQDSSYGSSFDSKDGSYSGGNIRGGRHHAGKGSFRNPNDFQADFSGFDDNENNANYANQMAPHHGRTLNYDQVQQFERQQAQHNAGFNQPYSQHAQKKLQLARLPNGQLTHRGAASPHSISSDFDLSTDVDDNEYNNIRQFNHEQFPSMLGSPNSGLSDDDRRMNHPGGPERIPSRNNKMYMSNSESEYESFPDNDEKHRSRHYFSDSDPEGGTPKSQASAGHMQNSDFEFNNEYNAQSPPGEIAAAPNAGPMSVLGMNSVSRSASDDGPSPRSLAIQEAQKARNNAKHDQEMAISPNSGAGSGAGRKAISPPMETISPPMNPRPSEGIISNFGEFENKKFDKPPQNRPQSVADPTSPVSELLAKAKQRRDNRKAPSSGSVSSAPMVNGRRGVPRPTNSASATAREKLEIRRREKKEWLRSNGGGSDEDSNNGQDNESWLYNEVSGALGPQGIQADLESLGERSHRSKTSVGARSHKSHRSHRSSSRRAKGSDGSVGSRHSRSSRASRYSIKSTKSHLSSMSVESRSVANDLIRLEMQLAMVGANNTGENEMKKELETDLKKKGITGLSVDRSSGSVGPTGSVGGRSRSSASKSRPKSMIPRKIKATIKAPPGKLGIILANRNDARGGTVVSGVRTTSVLANKVSPGDKIVAIDGEDVSRMTVTEITAIMARKSDYDRVLSIVTTTK